MAPDKSPCKATLCSHRRTWSGSRFSLTLSKDQRRQYRVCIHRFNRYLAGSRSYREGVPSWGHIRRNWAWNFNKILFLKSKKVTSDESRIDSPSLDDRRSVYAWVSVIVGDRELNSIDIDDCVDVLSLSCGRLNVEHLAGLNAISLGTQIARSAWPIIVARACSGDWIACTMIAIEVTCLTRR